MTWLVELTKHKVLLSVGRCVRWPLAWLELTPQTILESAHATQRLADPNDAEYIRLWSECEPREIEAIEWAADSITFCQYSAMRDVKIEEIAFTYDLDFIDEEYRGGFVMQCLAGQSWRQASFVQRRPGASQMWHLGITVEHVVASMIFALLTDSSIPEIAWMNELLVGSSSGRDFASSFLQLRHWASVRPEMSKERIIAQNPTIWKIVSGCLVKPRTRTFAVEVLRRNGLPRATAKPAR